MIEIKHRETGEVIETLDGNTLVGADLRDRCLDGADFRGADLSGANLESSDLNQADFSGATMHNTRIFRVAMNDADLSTADLTGAASARSTPRGRPTCGGPT
jgi:uncharacterized protein YjbI with pentapeptide repeats